MNKTTLKQKVLLVVFGFFLTIVLLEIGLRLAGGVVLYLQERHNHVKEAQDNYRILCLGESTTALGGEDSYPSQLEKLLNDQAKGKKFTVINKGLISTTSDYIVAQADSNLDVYKPDMVVVMMGINDHYFYSRLSPKPVWLKKLAAWVDEFKVVKLVKLLNKHISHRAKEMNMVQKDEKPVHQTKDFSQDKESYILSFIAAQEELLKRHFLLARNHETQDKLQEAQFEYKLAREAENLMSAAYLDLSRRYLQKGMLEKSKDYLDRATAFDHNQLDLYQLWGDYHLAQGQWQEAVKYYGNVVYLDRSNAQAFLGLAKANRMLGKNEAFVFYMGYLQVNSKDYWGFLELAKWFKEDKNFDQSMQYLNQAIKIEPELPAAYLELQDVYEQLGQTQQQEKMYLELVAKYPQKGFFAQALGCMYQKEGKKELAEEYFKKAARLGVQEFTPWTWANYERLISKIQRRGIQVVLMQYPLRSIESFKMYLGKNKGLIFVENRSNFQKAMQSVSYGELFTDSFAHDFGHCTNLGNQVMAQNLASVIQRHFSKN